MNRVVTAILMVAVGSAGCAFTTAATADPDADRAFYREVAPEPQHLYPDDDFQRLDYTRLRRGRWLSLEADESRGLAVAVAGWTQARAAGDRRAHLEAALRLLERDFTDLQAHLDSAQLLHDSQPGAATFHETVARGLLDSIFASGDGRTPGRAMQLFNRREQQAVLAYLGLAPLRQLSVAAAARPAWAAPEQVDCRDRRGRPTTLYFVLPAPLATSQVRGAGSPDGRSSASPVGRGPSRRHAGRQG